MTTLPFDLGPEARAGRECDCPEWVIRCVHLGETTLTLAARHRVPLEYRNWHCAFTLARNPMSFRCSEHEGARDCSCAEVFAGYDSEADALAAFYRAEEELLRGNA